MAWRMDRQAPFLKSVLNEADHYRRREKLRLANADQINALGELVMNTLRGHVPRSQRTITILQPFATSLRTMGHPKHPLEKRRTTMMRQKGGALWRELARCYKRCYHA